MPSSRNSNSCNGTSGYCGMLYDRDSKYMSGAQFNPGATINIQCFVRT